MTESYARSLSSHFHSGDSRFAKGYLSAKHKSHTAVLAKSLILVIMANGIIANYMPSKSVNIGTFCIDALVLLLFAYALVRELSANNKTKDMIMEFFS